MLRQAVQGISEIVLTPGLINLDFSDIKAAISGMGHALIGNAVAHGENAAHPIMEDVLSETYGLSRRVSCIVERVGINSLIRI